MDKSLEFIKKRFKELGKNWDYKDEDIFVYSLQTLFEGKSDTSFEYEVREDQPFGFRVELEQAETGFEDFVFHNEHWECPKLLIDNAGGLPNFECFSLAMSIKELLLGQNSLCDKTVIRESQILKILISDIIVCKKDQDYDEFWLYQVQPPQLVK